MYRANFFTTLLIVVGALPVTAQEQQFSLPTNPAQWINSSPISMQAMQGKGAVLYFFEES